jgi:hypothetical protein
MISSWDIYWITRLDAINALALISAMIIGVCVSLGSVPVIVDSLWEDDDWWPTVKRLYQVFITLFVLSLITVTLVPSTKEFAAIYLIPKIANNEQVQKVPDNLLKLLNAKLEDWINDVGKKEQKK